MTPDERMKLQRHKANMAALAAAPTNYTWPNIGYLCCDDCSSPTGIMAIEPGHEGIRDLFLLKRPSPMRCWCLECWQRKFAAQSPPVYTKIHTS